MKSILLAILVFILISFNVYSECNYSWKAWRTASSNAKLMQKAGCNQIDIADMFDNKNRHFGTKLLGSKYKRQETYICLLFISPCSTAQKIANKNAKSFDKKARRAYILKTYKNDDQLSAGKIDKDIKHGEKIADDLMDEAGKLGNEALSSAKTYHKLLTKKGTLDGKLNKYSNQIKEYKKDGISKNAAAYKKTKRKHTDLEVELDGLINEIQELATEVNKIQENSELKVKVAKAIPMLLKDATETRDRLLESGNKKQNNKIATYNTIKNLEEAKENALNTIAVWENEKKLMDNFMQNVSMLELKAENKKQQLDLLMSNYANRMRNSMFEKYMNDKLSAMLTNFCSKGDSLKEACSKNNDTVNSIHNWLNDQSRIKGKEWYSDKDIKEIFSPDTIKDE